MQIPTSTLPHGNEYVAVTGNTTNPSGALILLHGRGASADSIMQLVEELSLSDEYLILAPQAAGQVWYPQRFIVPQRDNQPHLDSALDRVDSLVQQLKTEHAITSEQIVLAGFSQGACLVSEYLKQHPATFAGAAIFSGGLIGSDTEVITRSKAPGDLGNTPIYIGCDTEDFHIPKERVVVTADALAALGAAVDMKLYEGLGHAIHPEGIAALQRFLDS